ncbi:MAG: MFS transporter [Deltaproteobacteria bacterium]|nr:MFS transporter [Deltaproteobacteria bacterium]
MTQTAKSSGAPKQLWVLMATVFVDMVGVLIVLPLLPYYARDFEAGGMAVGLLTSTFAAAQLLSAPYWGRMSDRYGRRPIILAGLLASAVGYLCFGFANSLWLLFATRLMQGFGAGTIGVIQAYVSDSVPPKERAKALGWLTAAASAGVTLGPIIGSQLSAAFGQEAPGLFAAGLCLLNVFFAWKLLPESSVKRLSARRRSIVGSLALVFREPKSPTASMVWIYALAMMAFMAMQAILAIYLMDRFGVTEKNIGWFYTYVGAVSVIMRAVLLGPILDRFGESRAMRLGALCMTLGFLAIPLAPNLLLFVPATTLIPIGTAMLFPTSTSLLTQRAPSDEVGQILGVQQSFRGISGILGPAWAGIVFDTIGVRAPMLLSAVVMTLVTVFTFRVATPEETSGSPEPSVSTAP